MWTKKKKERREKRHAKVAKNKHHRMPKSLGGSDEDSNISSVTIVKHQAYHLLFSNGTPYDIASILNNIWIPSNYELIVRRRKNVPNPSV